MYALNIDKDTNRILSATFEKFKADDSIVVDSLPKGNISDYLFVNNEYVYSPLEAEEVEQVPTELEQLRADVDYLLLLSEV